MNPTLLIVDDERATREGLRASFEDSFDVYVAANIEGAMSVVEAEHVDIVLTDLRLGGEDGMVLIQKLLARAHPPIIVMMSAYGSVETAVKAMQLGAADFVVKPVNIDHLELTLQRALRSRRTEQEVVQLKQQVERNVGLERLLGKSAVMEEVFETVRQVAPTRATVLVTGESGTGKELVAQAVHAMSGRPKPKFVAVHCAALSPQLLESELFGHEKGAFTGAMERRIGRFEQASGGTVFLDEIGEIDQTTQVKLLRVLGEERSFERVGGNASIKVDVRLVAATNRDLESMVDAGEFRSDLFFRLNVVPIHLPPLRDRREDIPILVQSFLTQFAKDNGKGFRELTTDAMQAIVGHGWPGNVRELRTAIEHGVVMATGSKITLRDLPGSIRGEQRRAPTRDRALASSGPGAVPRTAPVEVTGMRLEEVEERALLDALRACGGNATEAGRRLGVSRRTMQRRVADLRSRGLIGEGKRGRPTRREG